MMDLDTLWVIFTYRNLVHAVSGGLGNAFAIVVCYPLESARTRLQVDDKIKAKSSISIILDIIYDEGILGLYRGVASLVLSLFCGSFVYFYVFHGLKAVLDANHQDQAFLSDLGFGIIAGAAVVLLTNPLWVVNTRLKLQGAKLKTNTYKELKHPHYYGVTDCLRKIVRHEGVLELWSGILPSFLLVSNPAIQFMIYELLKRTTQTYLASQVLNGYLYFAFGAISKTIATLLTYPLQLIQTRIRAGYTGDAVLRTDGISFSLHGMAHLYRGLESKLSQTVLTAALMLLSYELTARLAFTALGGP